MFAYSLGWALRSVERLAACFTVCACFMACACFAVSATLTWAATDSIAGCSALGASPLACTAAGIPFALTFLTVAGACAEAACALLGSAVTARAVVAPAATRTAVATLWARVMRVMRAVRGRVKLGMQSDLFQVLGTGRRPSLARKDSGKLFTAFAFGGLIRWLVPGANP
ncbi:hypothetical protein ADL29_28190 [Streptomyces chattanoogensis]|uniref:Uncharacterized protein n=1 Tax=Streptomyces chattanoogensis TaxID=66876 RepID=A0A0N0GX38_9ACTN|nr:hypothetical protein ADL29_28190 [Streptomyces chattanoogensis]